MKESILIIGPFPGPPKGVSLSNEVVYNGFSKKKWNVMKIDTEHSDVLDSRIGKLSLNKMRFLGTYLKSYRIFKADAVYITTGITFLGVVKYAPFIAMAKALSKKTIVHIHSDHLKKEYKIVKGWKRKFFHKLISSFNSGIVLSRSLRDNLTPFLRENQIYELYNFVEEKLVLSPEKLSKVKDYTEIRLFFLSNMLEEKGINALLHALRKLQDEGVALKIKIAGPIDPTNDVSNLIADLPNAEYMGVIHGKQKQDLLIWGNVFCLPTYFSMEGQPISILEAMTFNNLILTTKHAGIPDICSDENAVFCRKKSVDDLYLKIKHIISAWPEMQAKALANGNYARMQFTESKFIDHLENIVLETLQQ